MEAHQACHVEGVPVRYVAYQQSPQATPALPFKCSMCEEKFKTWPACSLHLWRSHSKLVDLLQCPLCTTVKTHSAARMAQHLNHHGQRSHGKEDCSECVQDGASATAAVKDEYNPSQRWYAQKRCEICKKMLANSKVLKKHVQAVHNKIKPFICNVCGHSAARKHMLRLHMRQHTGEKPFACDFCSYRTGDHNTLRKHRMKHTGERPYTCTYCSYSSIQSIALHKHLKNKHPDQPVPPLKQKCQLHRTSAPSV